MPFHWIFIITNPHFWTHLFPICLGTASPDEDGSVAQMGRVDLHHPLARNSYSGMYFQTKENWSISPLDFPEILTWKNNVSLD